MLGNNSNSGLLGSHISTTYYGPHVVAEVRVKGVVLAECIRLLVEREKKLSPENVNGLEDWARRSSDITKKTLGSYVSVYRTYWFRAPRLALSGKTREQRSFNKRKAHVKAVSKGRVSSNIIEDRWNLAGEIEIPGHDGEFLRECRESIVRVEPLEVESSVTEKYTVEHLFVTIVQPGINEKLDRVTSHPRRGGDLRRKVSGKPHTIRYHQHPGLVYPRSIVDVDVISKDFWACNNRTDSVVDVRRECRPRPRKARKFYPAVTLNTFREEEPYEVNRISLGFRREGSAFCSSETFDRDCLDLFNLAIDFNEFVAQRRGWRGGYQVGWEQRFTEVQGQFYFRMVVREEDCPTTIDFNDRVGKGERNGSLLELIVITMKGANGNNIWSKLCTDVVDHKSRRDPLDPTSTVRGEVRVKAKIQDRCFEGRKLLEDKIGALSEDTALVFYREFRTYRLVANEDGSYSLFFKVTLRDPFAGHADRGGSRRLKAGIPKAPTVSESRSLSEEILRESRSGIPEDSWVGEIEKRSVTDFVGKVRAHDSRWTLTIVERGLEATSLERSSIKREASLEIDPRETLDIRFTGMSDQKAKNIRTGFYERWRSVQEKWPRPRGVRLLEERGPDRLHYHKIPAGVYEKLKTSSVIDYSRIFQAYGSSPVQRRNLFHWLKMFTCYLVWSCNDYGVGLSMDRKFRVYGGVLYSDDEVMYEHGYLTVTKNGARLLREKIRKELPNSYHVIGERNRMSEATRDGSFETSFSPKREEDTRVSASEYVELFKSEVIDAQILPDGHLLQNGHLLQDGHLLQNGHLLQDGLEEWCFDGSLSPGELVDLDSLDSKEETGYWSVDDSYTFLWDRWDVRAKPNHCLDGMVDMLDLGSDGLSRVGSSPTDSTKSWTIPEITSLGGRPCNSCPRSKCRGGVECSDISKLY